MLKFIQHLHCIQFNSCVEIISTDGAATPSNTGEETMTGQIPNPAADNADAHLIAAAPDLLAALRLMHDLFAPLHTLDQSINGETVLSAGGGAIDAARAAITKAEAV